MSPDHDTDVTGVPPTWAVVFVFDRYRWVGGRGAIKCGLHSAIRARRRLGGRVDHATATLLDDGTEVLSPWAQFLPYEDPDPRTGRLADPQDSPTREHQHG